MNKTTPPAIRLTRTPEVAKALALAKKRYPTLSDPEILKVGLAKLSAKDSSDNQKSSIRAQAVYSVGEDYLCDPDEDIYNAQMGKAIR